MNEDLIMKIAAAVIVVLFVGAIVFYMVYGTIAEHKKEMVELDHKYKAKEKKKINKEKK